ncbi:uncharacterized protein LOC133199411 [Saccostrea echinata]|uniref:uncharacterized protein LOC133199411 n=1 Tax=Saccostrea echinata TaxID=191078 RepID=UPI002A827280|nr:uncharacterized protein LOC133199411 [Saccostrea echinata]XP_061191202.1 uncharacterized protein LOC133199411 [Saccostrea echinata]
MEEESAIGENCLESCYKRCFGYGQHDLQTKDSKRDRFASGCEQCCVRTFSCICCLPCYDAVCERCLKHNFCYQCLHCSCFYSEEKVLPDCDTTPGLVRQTSTKSLQDKYVSPCAASNFSILEQPGASNAMANKDSAFVNPAFKTSALQKSQSDGKLIVKAVTHQPPRLSLLISKKNPYQQMRDSMRDSTERITEGKESEAPEKEDKGEPDEDEEGTEAEEVEIHVTLGDTGEEEVNTAKIEPGPSDLNTNVFIKDFRQTTV